MSRLRRLRARITLGALLGALIVLPVALVVAVGNPVPASLPTSSDVVTAVAQRHVPPDAVVRSLAIVVWLLWLQVGWAVAWEAVSVGVGSLTSAGRPSPPLVPAVLAGPIRRLVIAASAVWLTATTIGSADLAGSDPVALVGIDDEPPGGPVPDGAAQIRADRSGDMAGSGSQLVAAGLVAAIRRRRRYRLAHRRAGTIPAVDDDVAVIARRRLRRRAGAGLWLTAAVRSLGRDATTVDGSRPLYLELDTRELVANLIAPDAQYGRAPWSTDDGGLTWRLSRSVPITDLVGGRPQDPPPLLVSVADGLLVNLVAVGRLTVVGPQRSTDPVIRSLVLELAYSPIVGPVELRAGEGAVPDDVAPLLAGTTQGRPTTRPPPDRVVSFLADDIGAGGEGRDDDDSGTRPSATVVRSRSVPAAGRGWALLVDDHRARLEPLGRAVIAAETSESAAAELALALHNGPPSDPEGPVGAGRDGPQETGGGPVIRFLGSIDVAGADWELTSQQLSLVAFLAMVGSADRSAITDALWDGRTISASRFPNLVSEVRAAIGRHHLPESQRGRYRLDGIGTDLGTFELLSAGAARATTAGAAIDALERALTLVRGSPFDRPGDRYWTWIDDHSDRAARAEALVAEAACRLAALHRGADRPDLALRACETALAASPLDEHLVATLAELYLDAGRPGAAGRLVAGWEARIRRLGCGPPSSEPRRRLGGSPSGAGRPASSAASTPVEQASGR